MFKTNIYGDKIWYKNGYRHRDDGPAVEYSDSDKEWYIDGQLHREDGPAFERADGAKFWFYKGKQLFCNSQEEFLRRIKMKVFW